MDANGPGDRSEAAPRRSGPNPTSRWRIGVALALVLVLGAWSGTGAGPARGAAFQDEGTPAAGDDCGVPEQALAESSGARDADATPASEREGDGTPVAVVTAPAAQADPQASLADEVEAVAHALAACLSQGEARTVVQLATERYLGQLYGGGIPLPSEDYLALAPDLDRVPTVIRSVRDVRREDDDRTTAEVVSVVGRQLLRSRWTLVRAPREERRSGRTAWRVDAEEPLEFEPPADAARVEVVIEEYAFGLEETEVDGPTVVLEGNNAGTEDHEMLVLRLDDDATTDRILREPGPGLPDGVDYVGQATVPVAQEVELVLVDLEPGTYTLVCLFPTPRATPHVALGMEATFTVE